ncbi:hypothetical protein DRO69_13805 [Candidatus Bathyarchaeota archaeon]|nr:MAG: hypothetical protein DRO69_13805 [Candidatus Bathyarchaeota archaeon]
MILIWFFILLFLTFWNLHALSRVSPLSWEAVGLVFTYVFLFIVSVIVLLLLILVALIRKNCNF